jgi:hypothetical protein
MCGVYRKDGGGDTQNGSEDEEGEGKLRHFKARAYAGATGEELLGLEFGCGVSD